MQNTKSATVAGLLGIFLGAVGAHNWYLGEKQKGIIHCCLAGSGILITVIASVVLPSVMSFSALLTYAWVFSLLGVLSAAVMSGNALWGLIEGIIILAQGDAGLARKGYAVATPQMNYNQGWQQPMNNGYQNNGYPQQGWQNNDYQQPQQNWGPQNEQNNQGQQNGRQ